MIDFGLLCTAMVTPFDDQLRVDYARAGELAKRLVEAGNDSLVVVGTTGESPTLTSDEKVELFKTVKKAVNVPMIAGTGSYSTAATIELSKKAADAGADALLLVAPYYNKPSQSGMMAHFTAVAEAVNLPIMLYNIPGRTGVEISPETLVELARHPQMVAVKESLPGIDPVSQLAADLEREKLDMQIWSGDDSNTLPQLSVGGRGVVSVAAHVAAAPIKKMLKAFHEGRVAEAAEIHRRLFPIFKGLFITSNPAPTKAALDMLGFPVGGVRLPLVEATAAERALVKEALVKSHLWQTSNV